VPTGLAAKAPDDPRGPLRPPKPAALEGEADALLVMRTARPRTEGWDEALDVLSGLVEQAGHGPTEARLEALSPLLGATTIQRARGALFSNHLPSDVAGPTYGCYS
jgi:hypothetical protein